MLSHHFFSGRFAHCISAVPMAAFLQLPAFFTSCTQEAPPPFDSVTLVWTTKSSVPEALDLFFFDTLGVQLLDSYQQVTDLEHTVYGLSGTGARRLAVLSGKAGEMEAWSQIRTYGQLCKHRFSLEEDSTEKPLLYAETLLDEGASRTLTLELRSFLAAVRLRSVSCDFSARTYANDTFHLRQLFLSYAGAECLPLGEGGRKPVSWINMGYLDSAAVRRLPQPEILWQVADTVIGRNPVYLDRTFYCYPGEQTRLVLEGDVNGILCYYPIPLPDLASDSCVQLDVSLKRMGAPDADTPTASGAIVLETRILPWEERDPQNVSY